MMSSIVLGRATGLSQAIIFLYPEQLMYILSNQSLGIFEILMYMLENRILGICKILDNYGMPWKINIFESLRSLIIVVHLGKPKLGRS